jgi:mRNA interferase MazF
VNRGDIYLVNLDPTQGSEQAGTRPVLLYDDTRIIQAGRTVVTIPFTTNLTRQILPSCILIPAGEGGLHRDSVLLCHQIRVLDKSRLKVKWGTISSDWMTKIDKVVQRTLGMP